MRIVRRLIAQGRGLSATVIARARTVELDWDKRSRSRFDAVDDQGEALAVFLPRGSVVRGGDVLLAEDGKMLRVQAAPQPVMVVQPDPARGTVFDLLRAAYHLGNRHVPLELTPECLKLEPDHVLGEMLRLQHLQVSEALEPFEPEGGAYGGGHGGGAHHGHGHGHGHHHGHGHGHGGHDHRHGHGEGRDPGHAQDEPGDGAPRAPS